MQLMTPMYHSDKTLNAQLEMLQRDKPLPRALFSLLLGANRCPKYCRLHEALHRPIAGVINYDEAMTTILPTRGLRRTQSTRMPPGALL